MKYKCIKPFQYYDVVVANKYDIIEIDESSVTNITTSTVYEPNYIPVDELKKNLEVITDGTRENSQYTDYDRFKDITKNMTNIFERKNHDYGNSFEQSLDEEGLAGMRIRGGDKWLRFKNLSKGKNPLVKDESIRDTLLDLANYCIMTVMWMDKQH